MKKLLPLSACLALLLTSGTTSLRAADEVPPPEATELAQFADQLHAQGVQGAQFVAQLDKKYAALRQQAVLRTQAAGVTRPADKNTPTPATTTPLKPEDKKKANDTAPVVTPAPVAPAPVVPGNAVTQGPGMGGFVQQMHAQGLHGTALAAAIHAELRRRGVGHGHGQPGGPNFGKTPQPDAVPAAQPAGTPAPGPGKGKGKGKGKGGQG